MKSCIKKYDISREYFFDEGCFITELSNTPDDREVSIARVRVEPGKTTQWHCLQGVTERYVILEGIGSAEVGNLGPQAVNVGDTVMIPPGERQRISNMGENSLIFLAICSPRFEKSVYVEIRGI
ncbi:MAG: cupin domain-containing protein [Deltaproteobacteria bacterium]|nr:cupin domain-containing protein [Deltaproteobacteria bacterium]